MSAWCKNILRYYNDMSNWLFTYDDFKTENQGLREALCTLGNGYFATRGAFAEAQADGVHYPGTYLAGGYNRLVTDIAGKRIENEDLVNIPNWLPLQFRINREAWFNIQQVDLLSFRQELDLKRDLLAREMRFRDHGQRVTKVTNRRFVHMENRHLAVQSMEIHSENWAGTLEISAALDGRVVNGGVERYRDLNSRHLEPLMTHPNEDTAFNDQDNTVAHHHSAGRTPQCNKKWKQNRF